MSCSRPGVSEPYEGRGSMSNAPPVRTGEHQGQRGGQQDLSTELKQLNCRFRPDPAYENNDLDRIAE